MGKFALTGQPHLKRLHSTNLPTNLISEVPEIKGGADADVVSLLVKEPDATSHELTYRMLCPFIMATEYAYIHILW